MTEPNCVSDLKAIKTNAVDKGNHYLVNGQKPLLPMVICVIYL